MKNITLKSVNYDKLIFVMYMIKFLFYEVFFI